MARLSILAATAALFAGTAPLHAQAPAPPAELVDRVVAVVGDSIVLQSELDDELLRLAQLGQPLPQDTAALTRLRREILETKINELLLVQAAERDSVVVPAEDVDRMVQEDIAQRQRSMGGERSMLEALEQSGITLLEYRDMLAREYRRARVGEEYLAKVMRERRPPPVTEEEIRAFFEVQKAQVGQRPATLSFEQVVVPPRPSDSARAAARAEAEQVLAQLREGGDFEQLARRFSDDPGTRERGGDLGWFRRSQMLPAFADAAFALRPGQLSGIVETSSGFHIIRLERARGAERQARHILIRPDMTEADLAATSQIAEQVAEHARAGELMAELAEQYHDPGEQARVDDLPRSRLPAPYDSQLADATVGQVIGPFRLPGGGEPDKFAIVKVTAVAEAGEYSLDDPSVRSQVRQQIERQKLIEELIGELRQRTHVDIRL